MGSYTLTATAYAESNLGGDKLGALEMSFTVAQAALPPRFDYAAYDFSIPEDSAVGIVSATDPNHDT